MATGTSGGLLEDANRHAQSVFKHEILRQYMQPVLAMLGSTSAGKRLVVLDGFAGRGRYADGRPASAELILHAIENLRESRQVSAFFVEKSDEDYRTLSGVIDEYVARSLQARALSGAVDAHLDTVVEAATGVPLFLFLDPCGAGLPFGRLAGILTGPRRAARPQTELLLNFSADLSRRAAGVLNAERVDDPIIPLMDATCGGTWWRDTALAALRRSAKGSFEPVADAVAAITGTAWAILPTMAAAAAGFNPTAALTTSMVVSLRFLASACATNSAALAGSSAEVAVLKTAKAGLVLVFSRAPALTATVKATVTVINIAYFNDFINYKLFVEL